MLLSVTSSSFARVTSRKAARTVSTVDKKVLLQLNRGEIETLNLVEGLAIDFAVLAKSVGLSTEKPEEPSIVKRMQFYGSKITNWEKYKNHSSDTVRGWAAYALANSEMSFAKKMKAMQHFADDKHFGVREWAWLAIRPEMATNLEESLELMASWAEAKSVNVRRFSVESLRPRGVWCSHIEELKSKPQRAQKILDKLKTDDAKYVKDSVGNWLNDASKTQGKWVKNLCDQWQKLKNPDTDYIIKKALRSLKT